MAEPALFGANARRLSMLLLSCCFTLYYNHRQSHLIGARKRQPEPQVSVPKAILFVKYHVTYKRAKLTRVCTLPCFRQIRSFSLVCVSLYFRFVFYQFVFYPFFLFSSTPLRSLWICKHPPLVCSFLSLSITLSVCVSGKHEVLQSGASQCVGSSCVDLPLDICL